MFSEKIRKVFEECEDFIDNHTPEELDEYEKSLNLDYGSYGDSMKFSVYMTADILCNDYKEQSVYKCSKNDRKQCIAIPNGGSLYTAA